MGKANYLKTAGGLSVSADGKREIYPVGSDKYERGLNLIKEGKLEALYDLLWEDQKKIKVYAKEGFRVEDGVVFVNQDALPSTLGEYLVSLADEGFPCQPVLNFWANVKANPSKDSAMELFDFLNRYKQPLTEDGCFIGYRRVTSDFKDFYTRSIDNSVGQVVKMERHLVNSDRNYGCSTGLHVANYNYAKNDYHAGEGVLVEVKVNPRNVVSVPIECNEQKIRVCEYEVLAVCTEQRKDILTDSYGVSYMPNESDDSCYDCGCNICSCYEDDDYYNDDDEYDNVDDDDYDDEEDLEDDESCGDDECDLCSPHYTKSNDKQVVVNIDTFNFVFPPLNTAQF